MNTSIEEVKDQFATRDKLSSEASPSWTWPGSGSVKIGSEEHKHMFCRMLLDTFDPYKPAIIDWPELAPDALHRLTSLPFWTVAVETEDTASANIAAMAKQTSDPLIREALELMAFEERRHRQVLDHMIRFYGIKLDEINPYNPTQRVEFNFMATGYGECLDSFFAFGLFELARRSGFFPPELVETFEPVIREEGRHIVFFVNWATYTQANTPFLLKPFFALKRLYLLAWCGFQRMGLAGDLEGEQQTAFAESGRDSVGVDIGLRDFMNLCLSENDRRMGLLDSRLVRPQIMPRLVRLAHPFLPNT